MFWVTLTGVIAVFVYRTVAAWQACLMRGQLSAMQGQLNEMQTASALTRLQLRANVEFLNFTPTVAANGDWQIYPVWRNQGPTNADEFEHILRCPEAISWITAAEMAPGSPRIGVFPASVTEWRSTGAVGLEKSKFAGMYLWGDASYKDAFFPTTPIHHTHFCSHVVIPDAKNPGAALFDAYKPECNYAN
jgi:hypothetical protein